MALPRLLIVELCLVRLGGVCVLHLLETLSLRLSMALWTKPPMPLVGEAERSRSGEILPCVGDMASARAALSPPSAGGPCSEGGANFCESSMGSGDRVFATDSTSPPEMEVLVEKRLLSMALPRTEPPREPGELERTLSGGGLLISGSTVDSRDMPGNCLLPVAGSAPEVASSWLRLYAAEPAPRSGVCLNHDGSFAPSEAAIEVLDEVGSGEAGSGVLVGDVLPGRSGDLDAMESGRRMLPDCGLCFHDSVPERPNAAALAAGLFGSISSRGMGAGAGAGAGELVRRCSDSSRAASYRGGLMTGVGVLAAFSCISRGVPAAERSDCGVVGLSGDMERARSVRRYMISLRLCCVSAASRGAATANDKRQRQQPTCSAR
jgi:hypothetical protein